MLSDREIAAVREHAARIEAYESARDAEKDRLAGPLRAEGVALWAKMHQLPPRGEDFGGQAAIADVSFDEPDLTGRLREIQGVVDRGMLEWARVHTLPALQPYDTPGKLLDTIARFFRLELGLGRNRHYKGAPAEATARATDAYREAYGRAMAFASLAPSILDMLPEAIDPVIGLHRIRGVFLILDTPDREPDGGWIQDKRVAILAALGDSKRGNPYTRGNKGVLDRMVTSRELRIERGERGKPPRYYFTDPGVRREIRAYIEARRRGDSTSV